MSAAGADEESELVRTYARRAWLYGLRHLGDEQAASDLMQQVLTLVIENLRAGKVRDRDQLGSYVLGTCRLVVLDIKRGERRRGALLAQFGGDLASSAAPAPLLDGDRLRHCLEALSERERAVVVMTFYADWNADEIARELSMSGPNVRVVRHRAVARLQACMGVEATA